MIASPYASPTAALSTPLGPMPFRQLLDQAWRLARRHFKSLFWPVALPLAILQLALMLMQLGSMKSAFSAMASDPSAFFTMLAALIPMFALQILVATVVYGAQATAAVDTTAGGPSSLAQGFRFSVRPGVVLTFMLAGVAFFVGLFLCILPGLYLLSVLAFLTPVMRREGRRFFGAFSRCWELAHHNPKGDFLSLPVVKAFVLLAVGYAFTTAISLVVQLPFIILQQVMVFRQMASGVDPTSLMFEGPAKWLQLPGAFVGSLAQTAAALYLSFGLALLYDDLKRRSEGGDLEAAINSLSPPEGAS